MNIFAISDLHLSLDAPYAAGGRLNKPMDVFGAFWRDWLAHLAANWRASVAEEDAVLLPGDLSWAMTLPEARHDLEFIASLPGHKYIVKGNHDYWWQSLSKLRQALPPSVTALQHSAARVGEFAVCGTRGWLLPAHSDFRESVDRRIFDRECLRLTMALDQARALGGPILLMLHYPPLLGAGTENAMSAIIDRYAVQACVYGHVHGNKQSAFEGVHNGVRYDNCSADRLGFRPLLLAESGSAAGNVNIGEK